MINQIMMHRRSKESTLDWESLLGLMEHDLSKNTNLAEIQRKCFLFFLKIKWKVFAMIVEV